MMRKIITVLLCSTFLTGSAIAGLPEAMEAYDVKQYSVAFPEFSYLADEGNDMAQYYLGRMYYDGLGVTADKEKAVSYWTKSAAAYNARASYQLGLMLVMGDGVAQDTENGLKYLKKAAFGGSSDALYELGEVYANGLGGEEINNQNAFGYYLLGALKGNMKAQHKLSQFYLEGKGTPQDYEKAIKWLARSANQGYVIAQRDLAELRSTNPHMANLQDAYAWYSIIAAYNNDDIGQWAKNRRDQLASSGNFRNVSELMEKQKAATAWRPTSPEKSVPPEEFATTPRPEIPGFNDPLTIQNMLLSGEILLTDGSKYNVSSDMVQQAMSSGDWSMVSNSVEDAAKKGDNTAYAYMGDLMAKRVNDESAAGKWYLKGANAGDNYAQYQIAKMYCEGRGVDPDISVCYKWLLLANESVGSSLKFTVQNALQSVEKKATPEELSAGKKLAETVDKSKSKKSDKDNGGKIGFSLF